MQLFGEIPRNRTLVHRKALDTAVAQVGKTEGVCAEKTERLADEQQAQHHSNPPMQCSMHHARTKQGFRPFTNIDFYVQQ